MGAVYMSEGTTSGASTRHMDIRTKFVAQMQQEQEGLIKVEFVRSEHNNNNFITTVKKSSKKVHKCIYIQTKNSL